LPVPVGANGDGWGRKRVEACEVGDADRRGTRQGGSTGGGGGGCVGDLKNHRVAGVFPVAGEGHGPSWGCSPRLWADCAAKAVVFRELAQLQSVRAHQKFCFDLFFFIFIFIMCCKNPLTCFFRLHSTTHAHSHSMNTRTQILHL